MKYILYILFGIIYYYYINNLQKLTIGIPMNMEYLTTLKLYTASTDGLFNYSDKTRLSDTYTNEDALKLVNLDKYAYPESYGAYGGSEPITIDQLPTLLETVSYVFRPENVTLSRSTKIKNNLPLEICYLKDPDENIVGFCFVFLNYHLPTLQGININNVAVGEPSGQGICQYMIDNVKNYLLEKYKHPDIDKPLTIDYEHLNSNTSKFNIASCKCYLKNGFRLINSQSNLGRRIIEYNGGHRRDGVTSYSINYDDTIYNLIETNSYKTFLLVHIDSVTQYDDDGINQYYNSDDIIVCIERYSCSARILDTEESQSSNCIVM